MKLIVGLGNPGTRYQNTRHNVGQWAVDALASKVKRTRSEITTRVGRDKISNVKLIKTSIFMNESGKEVNKLVRQLGIRQLGDLLIVHDDLDLLPGKWKLQFNRSSAGHKGVQSVVDELGTQEFWRLRVGVGRPPEGEDAYDFVLEEHPKGERKLIETAIAECLPRVLEWMRSSAK
ncbi:MAG: aminoacyl-tRNA hydrolase [candidate division WWE3 bacterium]|nr:aminoacyl-tRNA hydrolase [candidate division WWE3 bacterium]